MFTGIVQDVGEIASIIPREGDVAIEVTLREIDGSAIRIGDSVSVAGACLTVVNFREDRLFFDVSRETLGRTLMGQWRPGIKVNVELAMSGSDRFGGHMVSGHIDGKGRLVSRYESARSTRMVFEGEKEIAPFVAEKGSITIDGVSLTVNSVSDEPALVRFEVNLVPHTLSVTTLGNLDTDDRVHLEVDLVARYLHRMMNVQ
ncbi:MAG: riboflavin synthase [Gammaproteobacteria bacterium]|nr:riboflavin synthase [Gammaproteobacteria bacterium]